MRISLEKAIKDLRTQISAAVSNAEAEDIKFELQQIELELEVAIEETSSGQVGVSAWIMSADAKQDLATTRSHIVKLLLKPQNPFLTNVLVHNDLNKQDKVSAMTDPTEM